MACFTHSRNIPANNWVWTRNTSDWCHEQRSTPLAYENNQSTKPLSLATHSMKLPHTTGIGCWGPSLTWDPRRPTIHSVHVWLDVSKKNLWCLVVCRRAVMKLYTRILDDFRGDYTHPSQWMTGQFYDIKHHQHTQIPSDHILYYPRNGTILYNPTQDPSCVTEHMYVHVFL